MKPIGRLVKLIMKDEKGAVLPLVVILMVVFLGMAALAVDGASLYQARRQMVNAADSAALAGAQELIRSEGNKVAAEAVARNYAIQLNGSEPDKVTVNFPNDYTIVVEVGKQVDFGFAGIFGMDNSDVPARSAAIIGTTYTVGGAAGGIIPLAIPITYFPEEYGGDYEGEIIDVMTFEFSLGSGNWNWISFGGKGSDFNPNVGAGYVLTGYPGDVSIGDTVDTDTGADANAKAMKDAIDYHIEKGTILFAPVVNNEIETGKGTSQFTIIGFAAIILTERSGGGANLVITAELQDPALYPGHLSTTIPDYGLESLMLISENDID